MITFTELVMDQLLRGATETFTSAKFDEQLGASYDLVLEVEVEEASGATPTITVKSYTSNSGKGFALVNTLVNGGDLSNVATNPYRVYAAQSGPLGKLVRLSATIGGTSSPIARVRIWVTGRMRT